MKLKLPSSKNITISTIALVSAMGIVKCSTDPDISNTIQTISSQITQWVEQNIENKNR